MHKDFDILFEKINRFITKYYQNLMLRGLILSTAIIISFFIVINFIEYVAWAGTLTRSLLFYMFIGMTSLVLLFYLVLPAISLLRIGKTITEEEAARIIGTYFPEVSDKLLNALQLGQLEHSASGDAIDLLMASISQKAKELRPIPFRNAISLRKNTRYLKYALPPLALLVVVILVFPSFITEPSTRIIRHSTAFVKPLPYQLELLNENLSVLQHQDFTISVAVSGEEIPANMLVYDGMYTYRLQETAPGIYTYTFTDLNDDLYFQLHTDDFKSSTYHVTVLPKPIIFSFSIRLEYPAYLDRKSELIENSGDLVVPEGTLVNWKLFTRDTRHVYFRSRGAVNELKTVSENSFEYSERPTESFYYTLFAENAHVVSSDSMRFSVQVIKDEFPSIRAEEFLSTTFFEPVLFEGLIRDDHGFHSLKYFYRTDSMPEDKWISKALDIRPGIESQPFYYLVHPDSINSTPGSILSYYFEVRDNDVLNGYKKSKTAIRQINFPSASEIEDHITNNSEQVKHDLKQMMQELDQLNKQIEAYKKTLFEKNEMSWQEKSQMFDLLEKEQMLQEKVKELNKLNEELNELEEKIKDRLSPELNEKIKELEKLMEDLLDEEMLKNIEDLKKDLDKMSKDELQQFLEKMKEDNEDLKERMEQSLELYKQMELEKKVKELVDALKKLSEQQQQLADENKERTDPKEEGLEKQQALTEKFEGIKEDLKKAEALNKALEQPYEVGIDSADLKSTDEQLEGAEDMLEKGRRKKASESQEGAAKKMSEMAESLNSMLQQEMQSRLAEDAEQVKKMLDNLLDLSFQQEALIGLVNNTSYNDPKYIDNADQQQLLKTDFKVVQDSLRALSKRQMMIKPFVIKESESIERNMDRALASLQERRKGAALTEQQYAMTSLNNLALMLSESLDQMKQNMSMPGSPNSKGKCKNPGQGAPSNIDQLIEMQGKLNQGMKGKSGKKGMQGKDGINGQSEELARMAAQQAEIRQQLSKMLEEMQRAGGNGKALTESIEEMKKVEEDIINRRISQETLERQKQLEVRLLKSKDALQEREQEERRKSESGQNKKRSNLNTQLEYKDLKEAKEEVLISEPIEMTPYYKSLLKKYMYSIDKKNEGK